MQERVEIKVHSYIYFHLHSFDVVRKVKNVEKEVSPSDARDPTEEEPSGELSPSVSSLKLVGLLLPSGQSQTRCDGRVSFVERRDPVDGEAHAEDDY